MKLLLACLAVLAGTWAPAAFADDTVDVEADTEIRFLKNFDKKIKSLENYSAVYSDGTVFQKARGPASAADGLKVKLLAAKKKS